MARSWFAGAPSDWTFNIDASGFAVVTGNQTLTMWSAQTGGTQYTDLLNAALSPVTTITSGDGSPDPVGLIPRFQGPNGITELWADAGGGYRLLLIATDVGSRLATLEALVSATQVRYVHKGTEQSVTSSTTLVNDSVLALSMDAGVTYRLHAIIYYACRSDTDIKFKWLLPTDGFMEWTSHGLPSSGSGTEGSVPYAWLFAASTAIHGGAAAENTTIMTTVINGYVVNPTTAGTIQLQWAQNTSNATAAIVKGSSAMSINKVA